MTGINVILYKKTQTGTDQFGTPTYTTEAVTVHNVLVAPSGSIDMAGNTTEANDKTTFQLAIPKGDTNNWKDSEVAFTICGHAYRGKTIGDVIVGIESLVPGKWHKKVSVMVIE